MTTTRVILMLSIFSPTTLLAGEPVPVLATNPFERPAWLTDAQEIPPTVLSAAPRGRIDLRATLVAGKNSSANVGGRILEIGEEIDGYTLVAISEGVAEFSDGEKIIRATLLLDKDDADAD